MSGYGDNIRTIARTRQLKRLIEELRGQLDVLNRAVIKGGDISVATEVTGQSTASASNTDSTEDQEGSGARRSDTGAVDAESLLDGDITLDNEDGTAPLQMNELNGITDCTSGKDLKLRFSPGGTPPPAAFYDADNNQITEAWSSWNDPPPKPGWYSGFNWYMNVGGYESNPTFFGAVPQESADAAAASYLDVVIPAEAPWTFTEWTESTETQWTATFTSALSSTSNISFRKTSCTLDANDYCPSTAPVYSTAQEIYNSYTSGSFEDGRTFDGDTVYIDWDQNGFTSQDAAGDVPVNYASRKGKLDFCFGSGRYGTVVNTKQGGFAIYETATPGGAVETDTLVQIYKNDGTFKDKIAADELSYYTTI